MYNDNNTNFGKVMRTITLSYNINERLKEENNASGLVEELLIQYFDLRVLKEHQEASIEELNNKEEEIRKKTDELNSQMETIMKKRFQAVSQSEIIEKLNGLGITNNFLIEKLKGMKNYPNVLVARDLKLQYELKEIVKIWEAWRLLHPEWAAEEQGEIEGNQKI